MVTPHRLLRLQGCEAAVVRPNDTTRQLLREEALSDVMWESGSNEINFVQRQAIDSLAALGENAGLVQGILKWGLPISRDVGKLRETQPAMSDAELRPALQLLDEPESPEYTHAIRAIGISGRDDFQDQIETMLLHSDFDSNVARVCLPALGNLANNCTRILERLIEQYRSGHHKYEALRVLGRCHRT